MVGVMNHHQIHQPNSSFWTYFLIRKKKEREIGSEGGMDGEGERKKRKKEIIWEKENSSVVNYDHES